MARPERNTVDYFPHIIGDGKKMFFIQHKHGNDGYATWFKILEKLASTEFHFLNLNSEQEILFLSAFCLVDEKRLLEIISDLAKIGAINQKLWDFKIVWSDVFIESIQDAYSRRNNKCIHFEGLCIHLLGLGITITQQSAEKDDNNPQSKVKYSKVKNSNEEINLILPFKSEIFKTEWDKLLKTKKWQKKSKEALEASLTKLSEFTEAEAIQAIRDAIIGGYQGIFPKSNNQVNPNQHLTVAKAKNQL